MNTRHELAHHYASSVNTYLAKLDNQPIVATNPFDRITVGNAANWALLLLFLLFGRVAFAAPSLELTMTSSVTTVAVNTFFTYTFNYKCASITENCVAASNSGVFAAGPPTTVT